MQIFLTGATGYIGSHLIPELLGAGHTVLGLTRSDEGEAKLIAAGAEAFRGDLDDPDGLRRGAGMADGVIHCAYDNDLSDIEKTGRKETRAIEALGDALVGSDRPLLITSVVGMGTPAPGEIAVEDHFDPDTPNPRKTTEIAGAAVAERGVDVRVVRLSQIHDTTKQGFASPLVRIAREKGVSAYVGDGLSRWPAAHVLDTARLYRLALEKGEAGARYHAAAEEGIPVRTIAEAIGRDLNVPTKSLSPDQAKEQFGWLALFVGMDMTASSALTRERLGWTPTGPGLLADLHV